MFPSLAAHQEVGSIIKYSQLSHKRSRLVHEKVVAYERWSLTGKIKTVPISK